MGRGRAKAKQTKVARELKYSSPRLRQELAGPGGSAPGSSNNGFDEPHDDEDDWRP
jgi:hypothetical protein